VPPSSKTGADEQPGGEYVMKLARSTKRKMSLALNQLVETQINANFLGFHDFLRVHEPLVV